MSWIAQQVYMGGPFMWPLCALLVYGIVMGLVRLGMPDRARFPALFGAVCVTTLACGLAGTFQGLVQLLDAVAHVPVENAVLLLERGTEVSLVTSRCALLVLAVLAPLHGMAHLRTSGKGRDRRSRKLTVLVAAAGLCVCVALGTGVSLLSVHAELSEMTGATLDPARLEALGAQLGSRLPLGLLAGMAGMLLGALGCLVSTVVGLLGLRTPGP